MDFETIKFEEKENGISIITLNRPDKMNAMTFQMMEDLNAVLDYLYTNIDCRVVILKGEGKAFCAGLDLKEAPISQQRKIPEEYKKFYYMKASEPIKRKIYGQWRVGQIILKMRRISQPIITIVQGAASGAGFAFVMASDIRIASGAARFNNAFIKLGFSGCDMGSSYFLPRLIKYSRAAEIIYTGRFFDAKEALRIGFVSKIVDEEKLFDSGMQLAEQMLLKTPLGLRYTKEALNISMDAPNLETMISLENRNQMLCGVSNDVMEGVQSFFEKRPPKFELL